MGPESLLASRVLAAPAFGGSSSVPEGVSAASAEPTAAAEGAEATQAAAALGAQQRGQRPYGRGSTVTAESDLLEEEVAASLRPSSVGDPAARGRGADRLAAASDAAGVSARLRDLRILLAEDNATNRRIVAQILKNHVLEPVVVAANGAEAVVAAKAQAFDVVLMDVQARRAAAPRTLGAPVVVSRRVLMIGLLLPQMPLCDGLQATREIREFERQQGMLGHPEQPGDDGFDGFFPLDEDCPWTEGALPRGDRRRRLRIIGLTANASEEDREDCIDAGMDAFVSKPVRPDVLRRVIAQQAEWLDMAA